jgi:RHS repeat-associated protein
MSGGIFQQVGDVTTPYGFTGEMEEPNNMVYLRARYYHHDLGRFISQDPVEGTLDDPKSLNLYAYANNNPVNRTDPSGLTPTPLGLLGQLALSSPWQFANEMNFGGMCLALQPSRCEDYLRTTRCPSIRGLIFHGCSFPLPAPVVIPPDCAAIQPGQEILPTPTSVPSGLRLPVDNGLLSNCDFVSRSPNGLPSRDVNPPGVPSPVSVYAPADGEVMIVDNSGDNAGLGNFVALRIHTSRIPQIASQFGSGYIYIGYAHLSQVSVQSNLYPPYPTVSTGQQIGLTGNTGIGGQIHLDVTAFFVPDTQPGVDPVPRETGLQEVADGTVYDASQYFQSFYGLGTGTRYQPRPVDPLLLWPELNPGGTICPAG